MDTLLHVGLSNAVTATLLALVAAVAARLLRRPAVAHGLWILVLIKLITPPFISVPIALPAEPTPARETASFQLPSGFVSSEWTDSLTEPAPTGGEPGGAGVPLLPRMPGTEPAASLSQTEEVSWTALVAGFWLTGSILWFGLAALRIRGFRRLVRLAQPGPAGLQERAARLARAMGLASCPLVCFVPAALSPLLWALGRRPLVLLPSGLWQGLTERQRDTLLVHELAHLRRRDHWVRRLELVVLGLYWWHPVAWWAQRELQEAEEPCCDAWVVRTLPEEAQAYAEALVATAAFLARPPATLPLGASGIGQVHHLKRRVTMILRGTTPKMTSRASFLSLLALGALLLPWLPTIAEQPPARAAGHKTDEAPPASEATAQNKAAAPALGIVQKSAAERAAIVERLDDLIGDLKVANQQPARPASPDQLQNARDEVELLEAQLQVKKGS